MKKHSLPILLILALASFGAVGCGDDEEETTTTPVQTTPAETTPAETETEETGGTGAGTELKVDADASGAFAFEEKSLKAEAGRVTLVMENPSALDHDINIEGEGDKDLADGEVVGQGGTSTASATLEPGEYTYYCSVAGHRDGGMEGTLTVE